MVFLHMIRLANEQKHEKIILCILNAAVSYLQVKNFTPEYRYTFERIERDKPKKHTRLDFFSSFRCYNLKKT